MTTALGFRLPRTYDTRPRVWFESLETRRLFSVPANSAPLVMLDDANHPVATVQLIDGVLNVVTGDGVDDVMLGTAGGHPDQLFVHVNGVRQYFSRAGITAVSVDLGAGDDGFGVDNFDTLLNLPTTVNGGAGDDSVGGENEFNYLGERIADPGDAPFAPVHLIGGEGNDTLVGGIGDTVAEGGPGNDLMYGRKGLFTILDSPPVTPVPPSIDDGETGRLPYMLDDGVVPDPIVTIASPADNQQPSPTPAPTPTVEPDAEASSGAAAAVPTTRPHANPRTPENSLLNSHESLFGHRADEIWS
jgi:Ca2+-binding RTX toxin-like protein